MRPLLETLRGMGQIEFVHRLVATPEAFAEYVRRWGQKQYARYTIGYFALHGSPGYVWFGRRKLALGDLGELLRGQCKGRTIYFGSCATLDVDQDEIDAFRTTTGARAVVGYVEEVGWLESAAFDLLLLDAMARYRRADALERSMRTQYADFVERLGFTVHYQRSAKSSVRN